MEESIKYPNHRLIQHDYNKEGISPIIPMVTSWNINSMFEINGEIKGRKIITDYSKKNYIMCVQDTRINTKTRHDKLMQSFPNNIHTHRRVFSTKTDSTHTGGVTTILPKKVAKHIRQIYAPTPQMLLVVYRSMNDQTVGILNVYLKSKANNETIEIERKMIETIIINTQTLYPNIILMIAGDFNARPESKRHKKIHRTL